MTKTTNTNLITRMRKHLRKNRLGQSTVEYILILAAVVMVASKFKKPLGDLVDSIFAKTKTNIDAELQ